GPRDELPDVHHAARNIAADIVLIRLLQARWCCDVSLQNCTSKPWCEPFDLRLDPLSHIDLGSMRDVAIRPAGVFPCRRAAGINQASLGCPQSRPPSDFTTPRCLLPSGYVGKSAAAMHRAGGFAPRRTPGDRRIERTIEFEDSAPMAKPLQ